MRPKGSSFPAMTENQAATGFTRGFFGCFGALAAAVVLIVALFAIGQCEGPSPANEPAAGERDANTLENATYCVNGLGWAQGSGMVGRETSSFVFPWAITRDGDRITCAISDGDELSNIVVEARCADADNEVCAALISAKGVGVE